MVHKRTRVVHSECLIFNTQSVVQGQVLVYTLYIEYDYAQGVAVGVVASMVKIQSTGGHVFIIPIIPPVPTTIFEACTPALKINIIHKMTSANVFLPLECFFLPSVRAL